MIINSRKLNQFYIEVIFNLIKLKVTLENKQKIDIYKRRVANILKIKSIYN